MMQVVDTEWSEVEKQVAQAAFATAQQREIAALIAGVRETAQAIEQPTDLWQLHDYLSAKRHEIDGKYDYRYAVLIFVFARLVKEGWLKLDELAGLEKVKLAKIAALTRM